MYDNDNFSSWLPIPSRPDDVLFSSFDIIMYWPSSETEKKKDSETELLLAF